MLKRIALLAILSVLSLGVASPARADETLRISTLEVSVWPEYDQPGVLVQYQGDVAVQANKTSPLELSFFVPKGAGVGAACGIQTNGNHTSETWNESDADNGLTRITYKVTEPQFHVEYYYNPLTGSPDKKMSFAYTAAMPADQVDLAVQHPLKATNFVLSPDAPNSHQDQDGFTYHAYTFKNVAAGQKLSTDVAYTKTDPKPSVSSDQKPASSTNATNAVTDSGINLNQAIVLATVLAMAGIVAFFVWQRNTQRAKPQYAGADPYRAAPRAVTAAPGGFCTQCGNAMAAGDKFCARCGSRMVEIP